MVIASYKIEGETPLECLERVRVEKGISKDTPMTYAGRLDPMAEGLLIVLTGENCKEKEKYLALDKEYEVEVLLGIGTDTGDVLGIARKLSATSLELQALHSEKLTAHSLKLEALVGRRREKYPSYSSKPVNGKPMFAWAREGVTPDEIPEKEIEIYSIDLVGTREVSSKEIRKEAIERIQKVRGDFRQGESISCWQKIESDRVFHIIKIKVSCSTGAYMRTLAERIGKSLSVPALAWRIKRTSISSFTLF